MPPTVPEEAVPLPADASNPPTSEVTGGRILRNTLVNGAANVGGAVVTIALTPFLLHRLGAEQYGVWLLALSLTFSSGYLALADLGLPEAVVRFIAEARATGSTTTINEIASTTAVVFTAVGAIAGVALALLAPLVVRLFHVSHHLSASAHIVFVLVALGVLLELPAAALLAVIEGAQQYPWLRAIDSGGRLVWAIGVAAAVALGHGVVALAGISLIVTAVETAAAFVVAHRVQPGLRVRPSLANRATLRRTFSYGSRLALLRVLTVLYVQMDRAIIAIALVVAAVASYEIAFRIESVATLALVMASSAVIPATAYSAARGDFHQQRELYLRGTAFTVALVVPVTLAAMIYARQLIITWVGAQYAGMTGTTRLFLICPLFWCLQQVGVAMFIGLGRVGRVVTLQLVSVSLNLGFSLVLVRSMGISGVVVGTLIGAAVVWVPYTWMFVSTFQVDVGTWLRRVALPNIPGPLVQVVLGLLSLGWVSHLHQLWAVGLVCAGSCLVSLLIFALISLRPDERSQLMAQLRSG